MARSTDDTKTPRKPAAPGRSPPARAAGRSAAGRGAADKGAAGQKSAPRVAARPARAPGAEAPRVAKPAAPRGRAAAPPARTRAAAAKPGVAKPGAAKPSVTKPGAAKLGAAKPGAARPGRAGAAARPFDAAPPRLRTTTQDVRAEPRSRLAKPPAPPPGTPKAAVAAGPAKGPRGARRRAPPADPGRLQRLVDVAVRSLEDDKAEDVTVLDVTGRASFTDRMIIATGLADRQIQAMATHLDEALGQEGLRLRKDSIQSSEDWVLIDAGDLVIHLFKPEARQMYDLERMWGPDSPLGEGAPGETSPI